MSYVKLIQKIKQFLLGKLNRILLVLLMGLISVGIYSESLSDALKENYLKQLTETSVYSNIIITGELRDKQTTLQQVANFIEDTENMTSKENMLKLREICKNNYFKRIGIIYPDKTVYITDDLGENVRKLGTVRDYFDKGMQGQESITRIEQDSIDNGKSLIFSFPLKNNDEIRGVLFASYNLDILRELLSVDIFEGKGYSIIIRENGDKIISSVNAIKINQDSNNVFENLVRISDHNTSIVEKIKFDLGEGQSGLVEVDVYSKVYVYYQPLNLDNLYILTIVPKTVIEEKYDTLMFNTYLLCIFLIVIFILVVAGIIVNENRKKKQLEQVLYVDKLTKGRSYEKFLLDFANWKINKSKKRACILLDIDNFRLINEIFGYEKGNDVLCDLWNIIDKNLEEKGIFARKYADRFLIVMEFNKHEEIIGFLNRIIKDIEYLSTIKIEHFRIIISAGVYILENEQENIHHVESYAMMASRVVKNKYDIFYNFYYNGIKNKIIERKNMTDNIYSAVENKEFYPYYQPKYDAKTKKIIGAEALIRWIKKDGTFVSPAKFIPIAEEVGIISDIDKYMFEAVCKQQSIWKENGIDILPISVNVSRNKLYRVNFIEEYISILNKYNLKPENIQFEITEGTLYTEEKVGEQLVEKLTNLGFDILIDDFGVGYSSISMIRDINATVLKIDKSFIDDMSEKGKNIIRHVISIAKTVDMKTVAEGVETKEQYEFLAENNCDIIQGYYFAKPMPADEYEQYLRQKN